MDGTSGFWVKFAIGKAMGAVTLQQSTAESGDQLKTNPQRFHSALSLMEGQIILIPGGFPLIVDNVIVGAVGSAGHRGDGDVRAVQSRHRRLGKISPEQTLRLLRCANTLKGI